MNNVIANRRAMTPSASFSVSQTTTTDRAHFGFLWAKLCAAHSDQKKGHDTMEVYYECLRHVPAAKLEQAFNALIRENKWFPKIPEILYQVKEVIRAELPSPRQKLLEEPPPSPEEVAKAHAILKAMIDKSVHRVEDPKQSVQERLALLKEQAEKLKFQEGTKA